MLRESQNRHPEPASERSRLDPFVVATGDAPPRATVQARLAKPEWKIEIVVTAAI